jgi:hypothetical protein
MLHIRVISRALKAGALLAWLCALPSACGESPGPTGGNINIVAHSLHATSATWVHFTLQSPTVLSRPLTIPLLMNGDQASTVLKNLPVANDYLLTADAFGSDNVIFAHGVVAAVSVAKGKTTQIIIYLNPVTQPPQFVNSAPLIDSITLPADTIAPGDQITFTGTAHDQDTGQTATLTFAWQPAASCGAIAQARNVPGTDGNHPSQSLATWTAPQKEGSCQITLTVQDVLGLATSASFTVRVAGTGNPDPITVSTGSITVVVQAPSQPTKDIATMTLNITMASTPDVDITVPLVENGMQWSALLSGLPIGTDYTFNLRATASDGTELYHGIATNESIEKDKTTNVAIDMNQSSTTTTNLYDSSPEIQSFVATATRVSKNDTVAIKVSAKDGDTGDTAGIAWDWTVPSSCGSLSAPVNTAGDDATPSTSTVVFTATTAGASCKVNVTVMDARLPLYLQTNGTVTIQIAALL